MANINRDYLVINDVKKSNISLDNGSITFYITDKNTQNIFVNLVINISDNKLIQKYANIENAEDYTLTMNIVKPSNTYKVVEGKLHDKENAIFEFNLNEDCCDEIGTYRCELLTKCNINNHEEITTSNKLTYKVKSSVLNDLDDIIEAPEYPLVIQLFDKLSDIEQYEEDRRANELARQLAEEQRQTRFNTLDADMVDRVNAMDGKIVDVENRVQAKEQAVDKLIVDTKADIDGYKVAKDQEIDEYKTAKDTEINNAITAQDNKIDTAISNQNDRIAVVENNDVVQDNRLDILENRDTTHEARMVAIEAKNTEQDTRLDTIEAIDVAQNTRLDAIEAKNTEQDNRLLDIEKVNKRQDMDLKCLFAESKNNMIDVTEEGNSVYLQNSTVGYTLIDEIQGNTMVNCNKEADKELILNGNINTNGYSNVTLTEGVDGGLVDVALEGNTMVNVCDQKDPVAITKSYTVETGNHVALQGEYDGKCRPVVTGNTLVNIYDMTKTHKINSTINDNIITFDTSNGGIWYVVNNKLPALKTSTKYTIILNIIENTIEHTDDKYLSIEGISNNSGFTSRDTSLPKGFTGIYKVALTTKDEFTTNYLSDIRLLQNSGYTGKISFSVIMLEGDYTNKPIPEYFEGLQSSFEDKLVTQEMVDNGEELAENLGKYKVDYVVTGKNKYRVSDNVNIDSEGYCIRDYIPKVQCLLYSNTKYTISYEGKSINPSNSVMNAFKLFNSKGIQVSLGNSIFVSSSNTKVKVTFEVPYADTFSITMSQNNGDNGSKYYAKPFTIQLEEGTVATPYEPYKEYTKTFYLNSPLLEGDTIEQQGDNVVHVHRYKKETFDGSSNEAWVLSTASTDNSTRFKISTPGLPNINGIIPMYCDILPIMTTLNTDVDGIQLWGDANECQIRLVNSKLSSVDVTGFKQWLQSNPVTVVYKLATPQYEVISQNDTILCDSYVNGHLDVDSVVPIKKVVFEGWITNLKYLYPNTNYILQFESDNIGILSFNLGTTLLNQSIVKGINKFTITTSSNMTNTDMFFTGIGFNASNIVVTQATDQDFGYFEGMKSVGECEGNKIEILSRHGNYVNSLSGENKIKPIHNLSNSTFYEVEPYLKYFNLVDGFSSCNKLYDYYHINEANIWINLESYSREEALETLNNKIIECEGTSNKKQILLNEPLRAAGDIKDKYVLIDGKWYIERKCGVRAYQEGDINNYITDKINTVYPLQTPTYEPIDYNPFTVYSDTTHISNNSTIPCNMTIKNTGYNCLLKPSTTYTVSSNLGLNVVTTPSTLTEDCLRFMDTDTSTVTTMRDVLVLEGDWTSKADLIPANFSGIESAFEQEYDAEKGKYKVNIKVANEDKTRENNITFYINKPLRGIGNVKDRVYVKDDKVVVQRNCGIRPYEDGDFGTYPTDKINTVYPLAEPTYEEVEYNDTKLFIESFKNSTLSYNSNVPVTSKLYYSYSVPIVDTVAQTANVTDEQDQLIINLATEVAVMEMLLM